MRIKKTVREDVDLSSAQVDEKRGAIEAETESGRRALISYDYDQGLDLSRLNGAYDLSVEDFAKIVILIDKLVKANGHGGLLEETSTKEQLDRIEEKIDEMEV